jgi:hypothetical protein
MDHYDQACNKYALKLVKLINPPESGLQVLNDNYLLLNIFSYFQSGWYVNYSRYINHMNTCIYKDIFGKFLHIHQVTTDIKNPYKKENVHETVNNASKYAGPVISWYKTIPKSKILKYI